jgi:hypothetical protein
MTLTGEQVTAIKDGTPVTLTPAEVGEPCVVLRADVYARLKTVLADEDENPRDHYAAVLKAWDAEGHSEDGELYRP